LIALDTLLGHKALPAMKGCDFQFHFIEQDDENYNALREELAGRRLLPANVRAEPHSGDAFERLRALMPEFQRDGTAAFVFVDPFGFKVPGSVLRELMKARGAELFVNVMWRPGLGLALSHEAVDPGMAALLTSFFDGEEWKNLEDGDFDERADAAVDLLWRTIGATWKTGIRMQGKTKYLLVHFTNHDRGRDRMKEAMWKMSPDGSFLVRQSDDPHQQFLISPRPDLRQLQTILVTALQASPRRWKDLYVLVRPTIWYDKHVNAVVQQLLKQGLVVPSSFRGRGSAASNNPLLTLR
jgi:three-Cys-motif partner protein